MNHYGPDASPEVVERCLRALGTALAETGAAGADEVDVEAALRAARG